VPSESLLATPPNRKTAVRAVNLQQIAVISA
jgi:hypothetical protein